MLVLNNIVKTYPNGDSKLNALEHGSIVYYQNKKNITRVREIMSTSGETLPEDFWMQIFSVFSHDPKTTLPGQSQVCLGLLLSMQSDEKSVSTSAAQSLCGIAINRLMMDYVSNFILQSTDRIFSVKPGILLREG